MQRVWIAFTNRGFGGWCVGVAPARCARSTFFLSLHKVYSHSLSSVLSCCAVANGFFQLRFFSVIQFTIWKIHLTRKTSKVSIESGGNWQTKWASSGEARNESWNGFELMGRTEITMEVENFWESCLKLCGIAQSRWNLIEMKQVMATISENPRKCL